VNGFCEKIPSFTYTAAYKFSFWLDDTGGECHSLHLRELKKCIRIHGERKKNHNGTQCSVAVCELLVDGGR
jgi:hypothetical protein